MFDISLKFMNICTIEITFPLGFYLTDDSLLIIGVHGIYFLIRHHFKKTKNQYKYLEPTVSQPDSIQF